jgi:hypothetical protein
MKKLILTIATLFIAGQAVAATPTATGSAGTPAPTSQLENLKERLATKVAELRQSQKKAIYGKIKATSVSTITVETKTSDVKIELTDGITVFQEIKGKRTELTTEDLAKDDNVVVFGDYDTGLDLLKAKVIVIQAAPLVRISGVVSEIDKKEFTVAIVTKEDVTYIVDIEKTTAMFEFDKTQGVVKGGFSRLQNGVTAHIVGTAVPKEENRISAGRFLDMGNLSGTVTPTPTTETTPTATASGTTTPKATPKATTTPTP